MISAPATGSLATVLDIAATVPPVPSPLVDRQNMLDTLDRMFTRGVEVVCVEGDDGIGKRPYSFKPHYVIQIRAHACSLGQ